MSNKPSEEAVAKTLELVRHLQALDSQRLRLEDIAAQLQTVKLQYADAYALLHKHLQTMDIHAPGNTGWEDRLAWFVQELVRQTTEGRK